jgi:IS1 family transposase
VLIQRLEVEADELASFVQKKANKQWVWIAMDAKTRQIIAFHVGDRSHTSAEHLWAKIPHAYRQHATFYTDQYVVYEKVIPVAQHRAISKLARKTNHIERFNNTLRQRVSRLVRAALSFYDLEILRSKWHKHLPEQLLTSREQKEKIPACNHAPGRSPCYPSRVCRRRLPKGWPSFGVFFVAKKALSM